MATFESVQVGSWADQNGGAVSTSVVTKPTSLAVGDLMIGQTVSIGEGVSVSASTTPSGWTLHGSKSWSGDGNTCYQTIFYKVADSSDVAASNFSFSSSGNSTYFCAAVARISSPSETYQISDSTGLTPTRASGLFLICAAGGGGGTATGDPTFSGYSIATDDPTWTEQHDTPDDITSSGFDGGFAMASATRTEVTATGTVSVTQTGGGGEGTVQIIEIAPQQSVSDSPAVVALAFRLLQVVQVIRNKFTLNSPTTTVTDTVSYTNESKNSASWINPDKS